MERALDWESLFSRSSEWTGADGIYSIPLTGNEPPKIATNGRTLFVFSDTFIGEVNNAGERLSGSTLINNTLAGDEPDPAKIKVFCPRGGLGNPESVFAPATPGTKPGDWYWLMDGISFNGKTHLFGLPMGLGDGGLFNFAVAGVTLLSLLIDSPNPGLDVVQVGGPLYYVPSDGRGEIIFGAGITVNTPEAGAPVPDGYIIRVRAPE